jgi:hypothetical protein
MKRMFALACLAFLVTAGVAQAAAPGVNLSWANCSTSAAPDKAYLCDGALGTVISFQGTFRPDVGIPDFAGISAVVDFGFSTATPDYWKTDGANCNAGAMTIGNPTAAAPCATPNIFDVNFSGGGFATDYPAANRLRLRIDWATGAPTPPTITAGSLYPAFKITFDPDAGVNLACAGCATPACLVLNMVEMFGFNPAEDYKFEAADARQHVTWQGGAIGGNGCPQDVPTQNRTWGSIKAMYR